MRWKGGKRYCVIWSGVVHISECPSQTSRYNNKFKSETHRKKKEMIHNSCEEDIDAVATRGEYVCVEGRKEINEQL